MDIGAAGIENKDTRYLLGLILLLLLTIKAFWFPDNLVMNTHPGSIIFAFFDFLFRLTHFYYCGN